MRRAGESSRSRRGRVHFDRDEESERKGLLLAWLARERLRAEVAEGEWGEEEEGVCKVVKVSKVEVRNPFEGGGEKRGGEERGLERAAVSFEVTSAFGFLLQLRGASVSTTISTLSPDVSVPTPGTHPSFPPLSSLKLLSFHQTSDERARLSPSSPSHPRESFPPSSSLIQAQKKRNRKDYNQRSRKFKEPPCPS